MSNIQVKIALLDERLEDGELQEITENLLQDIKQEVEVESAGLVPVENLPKDAKPIGGFLLGMLMAEVNAANIKFLFRFLSDRLLRLLGLGKIVEMEVTVNGKTFKGKASSIVELNEVLKVAQKFIEENKE
ncbi:MAG: hypothetical protein EAZ39_09495 [Oscillatoriales cyanobacterium]|uniref:hypothetical protein n=1 Tax=Microcoleus sp. PH2017_05_CCC_O_A TaxID=2798816 RepID=UPI001D77123C|nr:hypothetical protein [Microcoleus sp. PH2017_05_CCC_O_A]MCC3439081.1 hypothetical protein [Microcoleus sp. PH2017_05_CCC_O_A]TAG19359.1 MAG: hypothetical protein EAZ39_09495 [Oscillatoriales cyanobacterium]